MIEMTYVCKFGSFLFNWSAPPPLATKDRRPALGRVKEAGECTSSSYSTSPPQPQFSSHYLIILKHGDELSESLSNP